MLTSFPAKRESISLFSIPVARSKGSGNAKIKIIIIIFIKLYITYININGAIWFLLSYIPVLQPDKYIDIWVLL